MAKVTESPSQASPPPTKQNGSMAVMLGVFAVPVAVIVAIMLLKWLFGI